MLRHVIPLFLATLLPLALTHCAGSKDPSPTTGETASTAKPELLVLGPKDLLHIAPIAVPESAQAALEAYGWDTTRFASQLHVETIVAMRHRGIGTTGDSAAATAQLKVLIIDCERDGGIRYAGQVILKKGEAERVVQLSREASLPAMPGAQVATKAENADAEEVEPTLHGMKRFAKALTDEVVFKLPPPPVKPKKKRNNESAVPMNFLLF